MATTGIHDGHNVRWFQSGTAVAEALTCTLDFSSEIRESSNKDSSGSWAVNRLGKRSFTGSIEAHLTEAGSRDAFFAALDAGTELTMTYSSDVTGDKMFNCTIIISGLSFNAADNEDVTFNATFTGTGQPTLTTIV